MRVIRKGSVKMQPGIREAVGDQHVDVEWLLVNETADDIDLRRMQLFDGAKTKLHTHTSEQVLYCLEGKTLVGDETSTQEVGPGDVVSLPAGEVHWHAAAPGQYCKLLSIMVPNQLAVFDWPSV